jgi:poly(3-hydroxybutyrate) depolymerase
MSERERGALAALILLAALASPAAAAPPASGETARWLIAGPFDASSAIGLTDPLDVDYLAFSGMAASGEASAKPTAIQADGSKAWKEAAQAVNEDGAGIDFIAAFGQAQDAVAYAYRTFRSPAAVRAVMRIGSDDGAKVWINGKLAFGSHAHRSLVDGQDAVLVSLAEGENRILVKVDQGWGSWGFRLWFADPDEERRAAVGAKPESLAIRLDEDSGRPGGLISGSVMTSPAFLVDGSAEVELLDAFGGRLASASAPISGRFSLRVPPGTSEVCYLRAAGSGGAAGLAAPSMAVAVGDPVALSRSALATARTAAASLASRPRPASAACPDPAATLEFLADEVEGRIAEILKTRETSLLALGDIKSVAYGTAPLPGLHRYAYRSSVDGSVQPYSLYVPAGYDPKRRYGLVLALHGASGNDFDMAASIADARPPDMLVLAPYGRGDMGWAATGETDAMDVLDLTLASYSVDPDRVYLTGRSMGGFGTWRLGQLYSRRFAAIASFAGWTGTDCLENLLNTPVLVVHGEDDTTIPIAEDRAAVEALSNLGCEVRFDSLPGVGHDALAAWTKDAGPNRLLDWFRKYARRPWPDAVKARASQARYGRQAWVGILGIAKPLTAAAVDALVVDERHITVETENVSAFSLDLRHPKLAKTGRLLLLVDGRNLTADAQSPEAVFELGQDGRFKAIAARSAAAPALAGGAPAAAATKAPPNGGAGYAGLFGGPVAFVYGTAKASRAALNEKAALALTGRDDEGILTAGPSLGEFLILPDKAVDAEIMASYSLVLVGGPDENSVLARMAGRLPLSVGRGKAEVGGQSFKDAGIIMICPNPDAPGKLLCVYALPFKESQVVGYAGGLSVALRAFGTEYGTCGFGMPDVMVLDSSLKLKWSGCFDRSWESLIDLGAVGGK